MRAIIQRVQWARVSVAGSVVGEIAHGLLVYVGVAVGDGAETAGKLADKVANLRIFEDEQEKLNRSVQDAGGGVLAVPNFTLLADASQGRRPAFSGAARAADAQLVFDAFVAALRGACAVPVAQGVFRASMVIESAADGPVNILLEIPPSLDSPDSAK